MNKKIFKKPLKFLGIIIIVYILFYILDNFIDSNPHIDNFEEQQEKYENIVEFAISQVPSRDGSILNITDSFKGLKLNDIQLEVPEDIKQDLYYICTNDHNYSSPSYLRVSDTYVSFEGGKNGNYDILYTENIFKDIIFLIEILGG